MCCRGVFVVEEREPMRPEVGMKMNAALTYSVYIVIVCVCELLSSFCH